MSVEKAGQRDVTIITLSSWIFVKNRDSFLRALDHKGKSALPHCLVNLPRTLCAAMGLKNITKAQAFVLNPLADRCKIIYYYIELLYAE